MSTPQSSVAGGGVNAAMILRFDVLTAAQTGNTILLAVALAERRLTAGFYAAISVVAYVIGSATGELVISGPPKHSRLSPIERGLLTELVPLTALLACWHIAATRPHPSSIATLVGLSAIAMGIQSAVVLKIHVGPTTTYVTGTLTTFATCAVQRIPEGRNAVCRTTAKNTSRLVVQRQTRHLRFGLARLCQRCSGDRAVVPSGV